MGQTLSEPVVEKVTLDLIPHNHICFLCPIRLTAAEELCKIPRSPTFTDDLSHG